MRPGYPSQSNLGFVRNLDEGPARGRSRPMISSDPHVTDPFGERTMWLGHRLKTLCLIVLADTLADLVGIREEIRFQVETMRGERRTSVWHGRQKGRSFPTPKGRRARARRLPSIADRP
jgi:hypothetical protein